MTTRRAPKKTQGAWAHMKGGRYLTSFGAIMLFKNKHDADSWFCESGQTVVRVEVKEVQP